LQVEPDDDKDSVSFQFEGFFDIPPQGERMSAKKLCERCGIDLVRLKYLKQERLVSAARGVGRHAYYTEFHEKQVRAAERLVREFGSAAKVREWRAKNSSLYVPGRPPPDEFTYRVERVYCFSSGIRIVVPEVLGVRGTAQLNSLLAAAERHEVEDSDLNMERVLSRLDESVLIQSRPSTKVKRKRASPLPPSQV